MTFTPRLMMVIYIFLVVSCSREKHEAKVQFKNFYEILEQKQDIEKDKVSENLEKITATVKESLDGVRTIQSFNLESFLNI